MDNFDEEYLTLHQFQLDQSSSFLYELGGCAQSVLHQTYGKILLVLFLCLVCRTSRFLLQHVHFLGATQDTFRLYVNNAIAAVTGLILCYSYIGDPHVVFTFVGVFTSIFYFLPKYPHLRYFVVIICALFHLYGELGMDPSQWHQVRGVMMTLIMKAVSVALDFSSSPTPLPKKPLDLACVWLGYSLCPASLIFGPWFSYSYFELISVAGMKKTNDASFSQDSFDSITALLISLMCLLWSTCLSSFFTPDIEQNRWLNAYFTSQSFRFSHYFVSYLSEAAMIAFGISSRSCYIPDSVAAGKKQVEEGRLRITRLLHVEVPRSLVDVVVSWNLPMHAWLKHYIYKRIRPQGRALAILVTYAVSSLLHGLNFQLSAVLFSIGLFAYIEYVLRKRISQIFDACLGSHPCATSCTHANKRQIWVRILNLIFSCLSMFHLAYLAVLFDSSEQQAEGYSMKHALAKWSNLNYMNHYVAIATYIVYLLLCSIHFTGAHDDN